MKQISYLFVLLIFFSMVAISCSNEQNSCEYTGCDIMRPTIKIANQAKGRITILSAQYPDTWAIISEEGIIGGSTPIFDGPDIVVVCNFPDSLKISGQRVIFSAKLKDSCGDYEPSWNSKVYYGYLSALLLNEDEE
ncbi:MAG: hypothetical protein KF845_03315 [Cyclobacteriaceae bacterium]|nr:hypothetical protein [Cyclobacteriaceae bacterium]